MLSTQDQKVVTQTQKVVTQEQKLSSHTYTMEVMRQLIEKKKQHAKEIAEILNAVDCQQVIEDRQVFGEISEVDRYQLIVPMIQEGALYQPSLGFVVSSYFGPMVAVDIVALRNVNGVPKAVLIRKMKGPPGNRILGYATTGGICENGETLETGATRELFEESGVKVDPNHLHLAATYSQPNRDPRQIQINYQGEKIAVQRHIVSVTYVCTATEPPVESTSEAVQVIQLSWAEVQAIPLHLWLTIDMPLMVKSAFDALQKGEIKF